jgi:hypothetical protein
MAVGWLRQVDLGPLVGEVTGGIAPGENMAEAAEEAVEILRRSHLHTTESAAIDGSPSSCGASPRQEAPGANRMSLPRLRAKSA